MFSRNANSQDVFWARSFTPASNDETSYFGSDSLAVLPIRTFTLTQGQRCFLVYPELSSGKSVFSRKRTGENNASWLVSIKHNGRIYEATTSDILMEVTVVRMFRPLRHSVTEYYFYCLERFEFLILNTQTFQDIIMVKAHVPSSEALLKTPRN